MLQASDGGHNPGRPRPAGTYTTNPFTFRRSAMSAGPTTPPAATAAPPQQAAAAEGRHARKAATASFVGSTLEYYDFFIYGSASALVFNKIFFPGIDPYLGTILSMATIGIGYVIRPLAASIIGHYGDRIGRRQMLVLTLVVMGLATFLIGC